MQQVWRKRWQNTAWVTLAAITLVLLVSSVYKKNHRVCTGVEVTFHGDGNYFIDEKGVLALLKDFGVIQGLPIESIDLKNLKSRLETDTWIANAELFFDNKQVLQVAVEEKQPVARVFTTAGSSFYIDSACKQLPLSEKLTARLPMFTNFPASAQKLSKPDSALLSDIRDLGLFIQGDEFWNAQVSQVDITPQGFEMFPVVGNHVVVLGKGGEWQHKFDRLFSFYKQVWTKVGFEKYERLDVQFDGQVVATIRGSKPAFVDTAKVKEAYEKLLAEVKKPAIEIGSAGVEKDDKAAEAKVNATVIKAIVLSESSKAKAVMGKKDTAKAVVPKASLAMKNNTKLIAVKPPPPNILKTSPKPEQVKKDKIVKQPAKSTVQKQTSVSKQQVIQQQVNKQPLSKQPQTKKPPAKAVMKKG